MDYNVPGPAEYILWFVGILCEASVVVCAIKKGAFRRYLFLNLYMAVSVVVSICRYEVLTHAGFSSPAYLYFYYYSDAVLTILLYFALISLYAHVFGEMQANRYVRLGAVVLLAGTAIFSYAVVQQSSARMITHFVVELSQNLYFVGLVLTYILWAAVMKMRETRAQLIQLVLSLGIYFSLFAATYALRNMFPARSSLFLSFIQPIGIVLPLAWAYAFWRLSTDERIAPVRLALVPR
jgi:hypothetical protein